LFAGAEPGVVILEIATAFALVFGVGIHVATLALAAFYLTALHSLMVSIANDEPSKEEVLVDRPKVDKAITRVTGAFIVLVDGKPGVFLERGGRSISTFDVEPSQWIDGLASIVKDGKLRRVEIQRVDGVPVFDSTLVEALRDAGFVDGYRGLTLRG